MDLKTLRIYFKEVNKFRREYPQNFNIWTLIKFYPAWRRSLNEKSSSITDERPWMTFTAIEFLEKFLTADMKVYEYGSGGSTLFFAKRVKEVISVEHDKNWSEKITKELKNHDYNNWHIHLIKAVPDRSLLGEKELDPNNYLSSVNTLSCYSFKDYAESIEQYPNQYFDLVVIDGRARCSCFKHAVNKVKKSGLLVLDNAERSNYNYIHASLNNGNWIKHNFYGAGPYNHYFWQTCVWQKVDL
ncbi:hypothetical protein [Oxynema aestuarii]|uniref:Class I SAM-dependent methyltransferase n=1 Tax=Oxynema aestuarii AP17 TaxID=2064643 RepID=A0A6H1U235_9CYAN|nr:hypothetical protein [Oxynema aestuarii]QIZ72506.1 hypothetical protein HCG48_19520 [Oxynema aestuarii AP17]